MPFTDQARYKVKLNKYRDLYVKITKDTQNAKLQLLQQGNVVAMLDCKNKCRAGDIVKVPLSRVNPNAHDLQLVGTGESDAFDLTKLK